VTVVEVEELMSVDNEVAGLQVTISGCRRVSEVGSRTGNFMVCNVAFTALQENVEYSGQTLALTEYGGSVLDTGWWPIPLYTAGEIGDGTLFSIGDTITGTVVGEINKSSIGSSSDPVLLWEQAGIRYIIHIVEE